MSLTAENEGIAGNIHRDDPQMLLERAESYLQESVAPLASEMDSDSEVLRDAREVLPVN
jgi:hypothetical protein